MTISKGYKLPYSSSTTKVYKLKKSLYGITQANKQWYSILFDFLISLGYNDSNVDYSLFTKSFDKGFSILLVYVDS